MSRLPLPFAIAAGCLVAAGGCSKDLTQQVPDAMVPIEVDAGTCAGATTIFVNTMGGTYTPGPNDANTNTSSIVSEEVTVAPLDLNTADHDTVMSCVRDLVAPYNIIITETDPAPAAHNEIVVTADDSTAIGLPEGIVGIAPAACAPLDNAIAFSFGTALGNTVEPRIMCEDIVTSIMRFAGVENLYHCPTLPTQLVGCGDKSIVDADLPCGEFEARQCNCGGNAQNPHLLMVAAYGVNCSQ